MGSQNKTMPARIEADEKRRRWVDMRLRGMTYPAIATAEGMAFGQWKKVQKGVKTYLDRYHTRKADELRKVQGARLEKLVGAYWQAAMDGDQDAAALVLKLIDRQCRIWGVDLTPEAAQVVINTGHDSRPELVAFIQQVVADPEAFAAARRLQAITDGALEVEAEVVEKPGDTNGNGEESRG